ncbi:hypothetical protein CHUAL_012187 [Chamberlinius hualienensis]
MANAFGLKWLLTTLMIITIVFFQLDTVHCAFIWPFPTLFGDTFDFALVISISYTIVLPEIPLDELDLRRRRSLMTEVNDDNGCFDLKSKEGVGLAKLHSLLSWMGIKDGECQQRLLCMVAQSPNKYAPFSDIIFQHFDPRVDFQMSNETSVGQKRYYEFYETARKGLVPGTNCDIETADCRKNPDDFINWNLLRTLQMFKHSFNLKFINH